MHVNIEMRKAISLVEDMIDESNASQEESEEGAAVQLARIEVLEEVLHQLEQISEGRI